MIPIDERWEEKAAKVIAKYDWPKPAVPSTHLLRAVIVPHRMNTRGAATRLQSVQPRGFIQSSQNRPNRFDYDMVIPNRAPEYEGLRGWLQRWLAGSRISQLHNQIVDLWQLLNSAQRLRDEMREDLYTLSAEVERWRNRAHEAEDGGS